MYTGFWTYGDDYFECLCDTPAGDASHFLHGFCPVFALALHERFGYQILGAYAFDDEIGQDALVHMFCETQDGFLVDVRGAIDDWPRFMEAFEDEFSSLDNDVYICPTDGAGFEDEGERLRALSLIDVLPEYFDCSKWTAVV